MLFRSLFRQEKYQEVLKLALTVDVHKRLSYEEGHIKAAEASKDSFNIYSQADGTVSIQRDVERTVRIVMEGLTDIKALEEFSKTNKGKVIAEALRSDEAKQQVVQSLSQKVANKQITSEKWQAFKAWATEFMSEKWVKEISEQVPGIEELDG